MSKSPISLPRTIIGFSVIALSLTAIAPLLWANPYSVQWAIVDTLAPVRSGYKCAYDNHNDMVIFFGGRDTLDQMPNDIWEFHGANTCSWNHIEAPGPVGRIGHGLCYDELTQSLFLFGGQDRSGQYLNDTWIWNNDQWTRLDSVNCPSPRANFAFIYDSNLGCILLVGGMSADSLYGDTWGWDEINGWHLLTSDGPSPRINAGIAPDYYSSRYILYGGRAGLDGQILNDAWIWNGQSWISETLIGETPFPRTGFSMGSFYYVSCFLAAATPPIPIPFSMMYGGLLSINGNLIHICSTRRHRAPTPLWLIFITIT